MQTRTAVCYQKALKSKVKLGLKARLLITDNYLLLYNAQEYLNDLETAEKSTGNVSTSANPNQTRQNSSPSKLQAAHLFQGFVSLKSSKLFPKRSPGSRYFVKPSVSTWSQYIIQQHLKFKCVCHSLLPEVFQSSAFGSSTHGSARGLG